MGNERVRIDGACHCGNIHFELMWPSALIRARACGCTFCRKHGGRWTSHPKAALLVGFDDERAVNRYRFGTRTADFLVCRRCGIPPVVISNIDGRDYAVVNVNSLDPGHGLAIDDSSADFDGEGTASRLERRRRNWIADVILQ